jgi:hypothetical protein
MHFVIQTFNSQVTHDFSFILLEALKYHKWFYGNEHTFELVDYARKTRDSIPVGSVEFVCDCIRLNGKVSPSPKNVPEELFSFADRKIFNGTEKDIPNYDHFIKHNDIIKGPFYTVTDNYLLELPPGSYQFSGLVDFVSEWRAFVWRGQLVGLHNYAGEFYRFPNVDRINSMIKAYTSAPCAYTLDVGVQNGKTSVVEVHDFFSCGLYGFADLQLLPLMLGGWYKEYIK